MARLPANERKAQLLDTAARVFAKRGYAGATTAELAEAAGVSEPIIYRHFKSKKDLFIALVDLTGQDTLSLWEHELASAPTPSARLERLIKTNPMLAESGRLRYSVIIAAMAEVEEPEVRQALQRHLETLHAFIAREVRRAQEAGVVSKRFSPELSAWMLIEIAIGFGALAGLGMSKHGHDSTGTAVDEVITAVMLRGGIGQGPTAKHEQ
ncbi:MAG: TetR/AcrR family transcriptional regulator [Phycisphaeraceae bacterium]|jgi:AcrR family transcriptional regulator|nr:TetR/AcrR family transcriptional regulator [Phycisphaeraceae bacterium]